MIMQWISAILARWQVALAVLALLFLTHGLAYCEGREDGRAAIKAELRKAEAQAAEQSMRAAAKADKRAAERAERRAEATAEALKTIEEAEKRDENALDALF